MYSSYTERTSSILAISLFPTAICFESSIAFFTFSPIFSFEALCSSSSVSGVKAVAAEAPKPL